MTEIYALYFRTPFMLGQGGVVYTHITKGTWVDGQKSTTMNFSNDTRFVEVKTTYSDGTQIVDMIPVSNCADIKLRIEK